MKFPLYRTQYDRFGNRAVTPASYIQASALTPQALSHFNAANNLRGLGGKLGSGKLGKLEFGQVGGKLGSALKS
jgi:hypothetical protein